MLYEIFTIGNMLCIYKIIKIINVYRRFRTNLTLKRFTENLKTK